MNISKIAKNIKSAGGSTMLFLLAGIFAGSVVPSRAEGSNAEKVKSAMQVMKAEAAKLGEPKADGSKLFFGTTKMNGDYTIVDGLKTQFGCTATFFSKRGTDFLRISTNVLNDGNRALGTVLNPNGQAYAAIAKGEAFYGMVDILGKKYEAGYEPVKNATGETIGVYYVGFLLE
jgi:hypothetical protein